MPQLCQLRVSCYVCLCLASWKEKGPPKAGFAVLTLLDLLGEMKIFVLTWTNDSQQMDQPC